MQWARKVKMIIIIIIIIIKIIITTSCCLTELDKKWKTVVTYHVGWKHVLVRPCQ